MGGGGGGSPEPPGRCAPPARLQPRFLHSPNLCFAFLCFAYFFKPFSPLESWGKRGKTPASLAGRKEPVLPRTHTAAPAGSGLRPVERVGKVKVGQVGSPGQKRGCPCKKGDARVKGGSPSGSGESRLNRGAPSGQQGQVGAEAGLQPSRAALPTFLSAVGAAPTPCRVCSWVLGSDTAVPPLPAPAGEL